MNKLSHIVIDDFYENPYDIRDFALKLNYNSCHLPRFHSKSFSNVLQYNKIQNILYPFAGKIKNFYIENTIDENDPELFYGDSYNGSFQFSIGSKIPWIHMDNLSFNYNNEIILPNSWAGIVYLNPNPPNNTGTNLFKLKDTYKHDSFIHKYHRHDLNKWDIIDTIGNKFNRLILYRSNTYHSADSYFGTNINDARLIQLFFFSSEY